MKRLITIAVLSTGLAAGPVMANHDGNNLLNKENVGGAIGAAVGGLAGNKIVDGDGQSAATAAGAVGGFLLGKNIAHNYGGSKRWSGGRSDHRGRRDHREWRDHSGRRDHRERRDYSNRRLNSIQETFVAKTPSNVRAGPSTRYSITDRLYKRERVHVIGKVPHRNWFMIRSDGRRGFVYAPLLRRAHHGYGNYSYRDDHRRKDYRHDRRSHGWNR